MIIYRVVAKYYDDGRYEEGPSWLFSTMELAQAFANNMSIILDHYDIEEYVLDSGDNL